MLYRFRLSISDVDRGVYESLDLRVPMHPSESLDYLVTRVLAYALNYDPSGDSIEFSSGGLSNPDDAPISAPDPQGGLALWIDIGNPSARRLHKAAKAARRVKVYTYKDPENLKKEAASERVHRASEIEVFAFEASFLRSLQAGLVRDNTWSIILTDGELTVTIGDEGFSTTLVQHRLDSPR
jgi:uncharacterized protein YaeQ